MSNNKVKNQNNNFTILCLILFMIIAQTGCSGKSDAQPVSSDNYYLDTVCTISIYELTGEDGEPVPAADAEERADEIMTKAWDLCAELDKTLSRTQPASEVSKINTANGAWTEVGQDTLDLLNAGVYYSALSDGDFDITIGGVTDLWDFHADPDKAKVPDADKLSQAIKHVGYNKIEIQDHKVRITDPETRVDLGGIAKGYIGDRMSELLEEEGVTSGIINLGGNVICIGGKDNQAEDGAFVIGVEAPYSDRSEIVGKIKAKDMTLVTSGVYERQITVDGKQYHHILSTSTGYSVETDLDAITLTAPKGRSVDVDALSTICLIKGSQGAKELIEKTDGVEAVLILRDGTIEQTSGMELEPAK